jgi:hypothetical protein
MKLVNRYFAVAAALFAGGAAMSAHAAVITQASALNLHSGVNDINLAFENTSYTVTGSTAVLSSTITGDSGILSGSLLPAIDPNGSITNAAITLTVDFTKSGSNFVATDGSLLVTGDIGANLHTFIDTTSLAEIGFTPSVGTQAIEMLFNSGTGDFGGVGQIGVQLHGVYTPAPDSALDTSFTSSQVVNNVDVFAVPEPASLSLLGLAAPLFIRRRKARA